MKSHPPTGGATTPGQSGAILAGRFFLIALVNYGFGVALAWMLEPGEFGVVSVIQSVLWLAAMVLNSGFPWTVTLSVSSAGPDALDRGIIRRSLIGNVSLAAVLAAAVLAAYGSGLLSLGSQGFGTVVIIAVTLPLFAMNAVGRGALHGGARFPALAAVQVLEVLVKAGVALLLVSALTQGPQAVAIGFLVGAGVAFFLVVRFNGASIVRGASPDGLLRTGQSTLPLFIATASMAVLLSADILILQAIGTIPASIALYQVAAMLARTPYFVGDAIVDGAFPFVARAHAMTGWSHHHVRTAGRLILLVVVPVEFVLLVAPEPVLWIFFPSTYGDSAMITRLLAIGGLGAVISGLFGKSLQATGQRWRAARGAGLAALTEIIVVPVLATRYGIEGAAIGFAIAACTGATWLGITYLRVHRVGPPALETVRPALVGLGVLSIPALAAGRVTGAPGVILLAAGAVAYFVALTRQGVVSLHTVLQVVGRSRTVQGQKP